MADDPLAYRLEVPLRLSYETRNDPAQTPEHELTLRRAAHCLYLCQSLFWAVRHLGVTAEHNPRAYTPADFHEALEALGGLGQALAAAAGEQAERLAQLAGARAGPGGGG